MMAINRIYCHQNNVLYPADEVFKLAGDFLQLENFMFKLENFVG